MESFNIKELEQGLKISAVGRYFITLDIPEHDLILKFLRPESPLSFSPMNWSRKFSGFIRQRKRVQKVAESFRTFHYLVESKTLAFLDCFPETKSVEGEVLFELWGNMYRHQGFSYLQRKVEFFGSDMPLNEFDWEVIPEIQHRLWRIGVGLTSPGEVWGPRNWGKTREGEIRLADMSSLSMDREQVLKQLSDSAREGRRFKLHKHQPAHCCSLVDPYMEFMAERFAPETFNRIWKSDL